MGGGMCAGGRRSWQTESLAERGKGAMYFVFSAAPRFGPLPCLYVCTCPNFCGSSDLFLNIESMLSRTRVVFRYLAWLDPGWSSLQVCSFCFPISRVCNVVRTIFQRANGRSERKSELQRKGGAARRTRVSILHVCPSACVCFAILAGAGQR